MNHDIQIIFILPDTAVRQRGEARASLTDKGNLFVFKADTYLKVIKYKLNISLCAG